jgi:putative transposase
MGIWNTWDDWNAPMDEVLEVAKKFVLANCLNPDVVSARFENSST